ncbi:hypothetical protein [Streptomyces sp. NPDC058545]|uniref:hypothetical protein n=1 Tax=Streptomyces sp. NPDC058545 TaxID=3346544 RepID=UPI00364A6E26
MNLSDLIADGYRFYRKPTHVKVDCSDMRPLEDHLWHLADIFSDLHAQHLSTLVNIHALERHRIEQWLRVAASLQVVDVDMSYHAPDVQYCGRAFEYSSAVSDLTSMYATEYTRLLYTWSAVERLLKIMDLPSLPTFPGHKKIVGTWNKATYFLTQRSHGEPLEHYVCTMKHLRRHVDQDVSLKGNKRLVGKFSVLPWRSTPGILLAVANELRNTPAHGDLSIPEPTGWGEEQSRDLPVTLHVPRLAVRGLLLSLQMLINAILVSGDHWLEEAQPLDGWWARTNSGEWRRTDNPRDIIWSAHLQPPVT